MWMCPLDCTYSTSKYAYYNVPTSIWSNEGNSILIVPVEGLAVDVSVGTRPGAVWAIIIYAKQMVIMCYQWQWYNYILQKFLSISHYILVSKGMNNKL